MIKIIYDKELDKISPSIFMRPWFGENYNNKQILFIGESDYSDGVKFHINWKREWIYSERIINIKNDSKLINNIDLTILGNKLNPNNQRILWNSIAYTNLVQRPMSWEKDKKTNQIIMTYF